MTRASHLQVGPYSFHIYAGNSNTNSNDQNCGQVMEHGSEPLEYFIWWNEAKTEFLLQRPSEMNACVYFPNINEFNWLDSSTYRMNNLLAVWLRSLSTRPKNISEQHWNDATTKCFTHRRNSNLRYNIVEWELFENFKVVLTVHITICAIFQCRSNGPHEIFLYSIFLVVILHAFSLCERFKLYMRETQWKQGLEKVTRCAWILVSLKYYFILTRSIREVDWTTQKCHTIFPAMMAL